VSVGTNNVPVTVGNYNVVSDTLMEITVPLGALSGPVTITTTSGTAVSTELLKILPRTTGFSPATGPVGTTVTFTGTGLTNVTSVQFTGPLGTRANGTNLVLLSDTSLTVNVPGGVIDGNVRINNANGSWTTTGIFDVTNAPLGISDFSPKSGPVGSTVTIFGVGFSDVQPGGVILRNTVTSTDYSATFRFFSNQLRVTVPTSAPAGTYQLRVTAGGVTVTSATLGTTVFTVNQVPLVTGFTPASGAIGARITLIGSNLRNATKVEFFGGGTTWINASFTASSSTALSTFVPIGAKTGGIRVTNGFGTFTFLDQEFVVVPTITSIAPLTGPVGTTVTITGRSLDLVRSVRFQGTTSAGSTERPRATIVSQSATQIVLTVPARALDGSLRLWYPTGSALTSATTPLDSTQLFDVTP